MAKKLKIVNNKQLWIKKYCLRLLNEGRKEIYYLMIHSTHFMVKWQKIKTLLTRIDYG